VSSLTPVYRRLFEAFAHDFIPDYENLVGLVYKNEPELLPNGKKPPCEPFPYPEIHNEIRMAFTHFVRAGYAACSLDLASIADDYPTLDRRSLLNRLRSISFDPSDSGAENEILLAEKHIRRASMDAKKCSYIVAGEGAEDLFRRYSDYSIGHLDDGQFFENAGLMRRKASVAFQQAKLFEALGRHDQASDCYRDAYLQERELFGHLQSLIPQMQLAKKRYRAKTYSAASTVAFAVLSAIVFLVGLLV